MMHELFILGLPCGERKDMTEKRAIELNRDLYLAGKTNQGWKPVEANVAPLAQCPKGVVLKPARNEELEAALVALGIKRTDARRRAASAPAGTLEEQIAAVFAT